MTWATLLQAFQQLRGDYERLTLDPKEDKAVREQAAGAINFMDNYLLHLDKEVLDALKLLRAAQTEETK